MYTYKIYSYEPYSGVETPTVACQVMAFADGVMLANKTVLVDAKLLGEQIITKDTAEQCATKVVDLVVAQDKELSAEYLDGIIAKQTAKELVYQEAVAVVEKVKAKVGVAELATVEVISEEIIK
jgi:hypothetical protein